MVETLYRRKSPETAWHEEYFELTMGEETVDDQLGYFVRETQCWWDAAGRCKYERIEIPAPERKNEDQGPA